MADFAFRPAQGVEDLVCFAYSRELGVTRTIDRHNGIISVFVPYSWCQTYCPGWTMYTASQIALVIFQFIIPVIVFCMTLPRRWHLDLPDPFFHSVDSRIINIPKMILSVIFVGIVASLDMILWIACVMSIAGPTLFSAILEAFLDQLVVAELRKDRSQGVSPPRLSREDRAELLSTLLCGNFDLDNARARTRIQTRLIPTSWYRNDIQALQSRLGSIMNAQPSFGSYVGVPSLFLLGGFAYNALDINIESATGLNWVPFAIFWMLLLILSVVSATLLTGNNPSSVSVLIATGSIPQHVQRKWWVFLKDYFEGELHPVSVWKRGYAKRRWIRESNAVARHGRLQALLELGVFHWTLITSLSLLLMLFPLVMAYCWAYYIPYDRMGCRTLTYSIYMASQTYLIFAALYCEVGRKSYFAILAERPWRAQPTPRPGMPLPPPNISPSRRTFHTLAWLVLFVLLPTLAVIASFIVVLPGSFFQILGVYNSCQCQSDVRTWMDPVNSRWTWIGNRINDDALNRLEGETQAMIWATTVIIGVVVYLGWWYQRVLRTSMGTLIIGLDQP